MSEKVAELSEAIAALILVVLKIYRRKVNGNK